MLLNAILCLYFTIQILVELYNHIINIIYHYIFIHPKHEATRRAQNENNIGAAPKKQIATSDE